jgi:hypothetical protein
VAIWIIEDPDVLDLPLRVIYSFLELFSGRGEVAQIM